MKIMTTILFLFLSTQVYAQYDSVFVEIDSDTVTVWNTLVAENCAFVVEFNVDINDNTITIVEHDTVTQKATCGCVFDLNVKLTNLESANYTVNVYRQYSAEYYNTDSLYYIGTTHFSYQKTSLDTLLKSYYQSGCYTLQSLDQKEIIPENLFLLSSYPNPFNSQTKLKIYIPYKSAIELKLYDLSGKLVKIIASESFVRGNYFFKIDAENYSSGNYIVTLESDNVLKKSAKISLVK